MLSSNNRELPVTVRTTKKQSKSQTIDFQPWINLYYHKGNVFLTLNKYVNKSRRSIAWAIEEEML